MRKEDLRGDHMRLDAVLRNVEIIGEAARHIPDDVAKRYPGIDWANARAMRNILAHGYAIVSFEIVWRTIIKDIPPLEAALRTDARRYKDESE